MSVSVSGHDLKNAVVDGKKGDIEGAATKIKDQDILLSFLLVQAIGDGSGSGLVDDSHDGHARNGTSILGGLPLGVIEVGGHSDDGVGDLLSKESLSGLLHLGEHHGRDLLRSKGLLTLAGLNLDVRLGVLVDKLEGEELDVGLDGLVGELTPDETLGIEDGVLRVGGQLVLGGVADQPLAVSGECNIARGDTVALVVGDDLNSSVLKHSNARIDSLEEDRTKTCPMLFGQF